MQKSANDIITHRTIKPGCAFTTTKGRGQTQAIRIGVVCKRIKGSKDRMNHIYTIRKVQPIIGHHLNKCGQRREHTQPGVIGPGLIPQDIAGYSKES
jgi:hypothetical protein